MDELMATEDGTSYRLRLRMASDSIPPTTKASNLKSWLRLGGVTALALDNVSALITKYVRPTNTPTEIYAGRFACCTPPPLSVTLRMRRAPY